jgi:hypothetical protein
MPSQLPTISVGDRSGDNIITAINSAAFKERSIGIAAVSAAIALILLI